jgi:hypothetical protein
VPDDDHTDKWLNPKRASGAFNVVLFGLLALFVAALVAYLVMASQN